MDFAVFVMHLQTSLKEIYLYQFIVTTNSYHLIKINPAVGRCAAFYSLQADRWFKCCSLASWDKADYLFEQLETEAANSFLFKLAPFWDYKASVLFCVFGNFWSNLKPYKG